MPHLTPSKKEESCLILEFQVGRWETSRDEMVMDFRNRRAVDKG